VALEDIRLLLLRPQDLAIAAARLINFQSAGSTVTALAGARVDLTLPPQATGEMVYVAAVGLAQARIGGPTKLTYTVEPGTTAPLTAAGILALASNGQPDVEALAVELPWHITFNPRSVSGDPLLSDLPVDPLVGATGASGLWHVRLEAASGVALHPVDVDDDGDILPPLDRFRRDRIFAEGGQPDRQPLTPYLDLSPLGGTMHAKGTWDTFSWEHETVLGRDMVVRTESRGFLYPWGHRAILIETAVRELVPPDGPTATAGLQEIRLLVVPDPVRRRAAEGELARSLPFDEVEILQPITQLGGEEVPPEAVYQRPAKRLDQLRADRDQQQIDRQNQEQLVSDLFVQRHADIDAIAQSDADSLNGQLGPISEEIATLEQKKADWEAFASLPVRVEPPHVEVILGPDGLEETVVVDTPFEPVPAPPVFTHEDFLKLEQFEADGARLTEQLLAIEPARIAAHNALVLPDGNPNEDALASLGGGFFDAIAKVRQMRIDVPAFAAFVDQISRDADQFHNVYVWPKAISGARLELPLRCDTLRTTTPVLFLHDLQFADSEDFPAFVSLQTQEWLDKIRDAWLGNRQRHLQVPGIAVDLVRSGPVPQAADVLPVHELSIAGRQAPDGTFRAAIEEAKVALQAVAELVPDAKALTRVRFDPAFLRNGIADKIALRLPAGIPIDFTKAADKAGGLISPVFKADVLSRIDGPVDARGLPGLLPGPPDLSAVFSDATILGIPLGSLVDNVSLPKPLAIVTRPDGGAEMSWKDLKLKDHGPFKSKPNTSFEMTVIRSPAETVTRCTIANFVLVLPPGGDLVELHFASLKFEQRPGEAPDLDVKGFEFKLGGHLSLLQTLQEKFKFDAAEPKVEATPNGMKAGYSLAVPEVTAGVFVMKNIAASVSVEVPFDGEPIVTSLAFANRENPFSLSVSMFGGSGYLVFEIAEEGIRKLEASLDFGAAVAIGVGVAKAEVHALGGVRFLLVGSEVKVSGFLRIGGSVDVLGLVSVSVELRVELTYDGQTLSGRATAVIQIDVTFWSGSISIDSGEYVFAGSAAVGQAAQPHTSIEAHDPSLSDWQKYRDKFGSAG
jgi:hypothetical protein